MGARDVLVVFVGFDVFTRFLSGTCFERAAAAEVFLQCRLIGRIYMEDYIDKWVFMPFNTSLLLTLIRFECDGLLDAISEFSWEGNLLETVNVSRAELS